MRTNKLFIALLICTACGGGQPEEVKMNNTAADSVPSALQTASAQSSSEENGMDGESGATNVANHTSFNGTLVIPPQKKATVTLPMGGDIHTLNMLPGEFVRRGTVLATLRNPEFIDLQQQYLEAVAQEEFLEKEFLRQQRLSKEEAASLKRFEQSKADFLAVQARKSAAAARLTILGVDPLAIRTSGIRPYLEIKAPIDGFVTTMNVNSGTFINPGDKICDLVNKNDFMLCLTAFEKDLEELQPGRKISFRVNGMDEAVFEAELTFVGQQIDEVSRSLEVYARVKEGNPRFRPGMYVTARIEKK